MSELKKQKQGSIIHCQKCGFYARYVPFELLPDGTVNFTVSLRHDLIEGRGVQHELSVERSRRHPADQGPARGRATAAPRGRLRDGEEKS